MIQIANFRFVNCLLMVLNLKNNFFYKIKRNIFEMSTSTHTLARFWIFDTQILFHLRIKIKHNILFLQFKFHKNRKRKKW